MKDEMGDGRQLIQRVVSDNDPCPSCGYRARIIRQTAETPPAGLVARIMGQADAGVIVESRARIVEVFVLCLQCLGRERWGWEGDKWMLLQEFPTSQDLGPVRRHGS